MGVETTGQLETDAVIKDLLSARPCDLHSHVHVSIAHHDPRKEDLLLSPFYKKGN